MLEPHTWETTEAFMVNFLSICLFFFMQSEEKNKTLHICPALSALVFTPSLSQTVCLLSLCGSEALKLHFSDVGSQEEPGLGGRCLEELSHTQTHTHFYTHTHAHTASSFVRLSSQSSLIHLLYTRLSYGNAF